MFRLWGRWSLLPGTGLSQVPADQEQESHDERDRYSDGQDDERNGQDNREQHQRIQDDIRHMPYENTHGVHRSSDEHLPLGRKNRRDLTLGDRVVLHGSALWTRVKAGGNGFSIILTGVATVVCAALHRHRERLCTSSPVETPGNGPLAMGSDSVSSVPRT